MSSKVFWVSPEFFDNEGIFFLWLDTFGIRSEFEVLEACPEGLIVEVSEIGNQG